MESGESERERVRGVESVERKCERRIQFTIQLGAAPAASFMRLLSKNRRCQFASILLLLLLLFLKLRSLAFLLIFVLFVVVVVSCVDFRNFT